MLQTIPCSNLMKIKKGRKGRTFRHASCYYYSHFNKGNLDQLVLEVSMYYLSFFLFSWELWMRGAGAAGGIFTNYFVGLRSSLPDCCFGSKYLLCSSRPFSLSNTVKAANPSWFPRTIFRLSSKNQYSVRTLPWLGSTLSSLHNQMSS